MVWLVIISELCFWTLIYEQKTPLKGCFTIILESVHYFLTTPRGAHVDNFIFISSDFVISIYLPNLGHHVNATEANRISLVVLTYLTVPKLYLKCFKKTNEILTEMSQTDISKRWTNTVKPKLSACWTAVSFGWLFM